MPEYDIALELARLHILSGADFIRQLKMLTSLSIFKPVDGEKDIFAAEGSHRQDFPLLLDAARKAVNHGNKVYILPNPRDIRTADFIFVRKGVYKLFDLKTITGKNSVGNRLSDSVEQTNRVLLNMSVEYNPSSLARSIKRYFEYNVDAKEVLIFKGQKQISITGKSLEDKDFFQRFIKRYHK